MLLCTSFKPQNLLYAQTKTKLRAKKKIYTLQKVAHDLIGFLEAYFFMEISKPCMKKAVFPKQKYFMEIGASTLRK